MPATDPTQGTFFNNPIYVRNPCYAGGSGCPTETNVAKGSAAISDGAFAVASTASVGWKLNAIHWEAIPDGTGVESAIAFTSGWLYIYVGALSTTSPTAVNLIKRIHMEALSGDFAPPNDDWEFQASDEVYISQSGALSLVVSGSCGLI